MHSTFLLCLWLAGKAGSHFLPMLFRFGLVGLGLVSIVDSSFVPLPVPGVTDIMLILYAAGHVNPVLLVAISTAGSAIGGFLSHAVGQAGGMAFLEKKVPPKLLKRVTQWAEAHSVLSIALRHVIACWLGVRYGAQVLRMWNQFSSKWAVTVLVVFWAVLIVFSAVGIWKLVQTSRAVAKHPGAGDGSQGQARSASA